MRKKVILIIVILVILGLMYNLFQKPFRWKINANEVKGVFLNEKQVTEEQKSKIVKAYNNMRYVRKRDSLNGSTPKYVCRIELNSGEIISIQDVGITHLIVDKKKGTSSTSYWAESSDFYNIAENIPLKNNE